MQPCGPLSYDTVRLCNSRRCHATRRGAVARWPPLHCLAFAPRLSRCNAEAKHTTFPHINNIRARLRLG